MDTQTRMLALGLLAPGVIGLIGAVLTLRARRSDAQAGAGTGVLAAAGTIAALGIASVISQWGIVGPIPSLTLSSDGRLRVASVLVAVGGLAALGLIIAAGGRFAFLLAAALGALAATNVAAPNIGLAGSAQPLQKVLTIGAVAAACAVSTWALSALLERRQRIASAAVLTGLAFAIGAAVLGTGGSKVGLLGLGLGAALLGMLVVIVFRRAAAIAPPAIAVAVALLAALLMAGHAYASTPAWLALGLAGVPVAALLTAVLAQRTQIAKSPALIGVAAVLVAAAVAGALVAPGLASLAKVESGRGAGEYEY